MAATQARARTDVQLAVPRADEHHTLPVHEVVLVMETDVEQGLPAAEADDRLGRYGPNVLPAAVRAGWSVRLARQFHNPLVYVLIASGAVTAALGEAVDSAVIVGVVLVNAAVGFLQESKAEAALDALRAMGRTRARVRRDGVVGVVDSRDLVPGDVVLLEAGEKVPADLRLAGLTELRVDESALTGESEPVVKDESVLPLSTPVSDRRNMVYAGTLVTAGTGAGIVVATGPATELGEIQRLVGTAEVLATPLTRKLARFSKVLTVAILALAALTFAAGTARGADTASTFTAAVALAVGAIPEGLPAAVTITLAIGVGRMARRRAIIRRLPAVETLGSTTVICTDKTGTLTRNQMTVRRVWTTDACFEVTGSGYAPAGRVVRGDGRPVGRDEALRWTVLAGALCNDSRVQPRDGGWEVVGDPTEGALVVLARKAGLDVEALRRDRPRRASVPFASERAFMATLHGAADGVRVRGTGGEDAGIGENAGIGEAWDRRAEDVVLVKGAVEQVLALCTGQLDAHGVVHPVQPDRVHAEAEVLAAEGLRVLATAVGPREAWRPVADGDADQVAGPLTLTGLVGMLDPPRDAAAAAVDACRTAGVEVKMITGDHAVTATAVARQVGLLAPGEAEAGGTVLTGPELAALDDADLPAAVERARVFARVSPEQKLRLVRALQRREHVVAMTGDGVNDAPALRQADIGVAMGAGGTEVAKEAADMVLTDDDFATIEGAVEEGRGVFDNLTKFIVWTLPTNMGEGLVILVAVLLGAALPILPVQILWINMTTAVLLGLMLAFEPQEAGIMTRPPRDPRRPLLTGELVLRILLVSALLVGGSWWLFEVELAAGASLEEARTAALNLFVAVQVVYLVTCRSLGGPVWRVGWFSNRWILAGVVVQLLAQAALTYLPVMNTLFSTAPIGPDAWVRIAALSVAAGAVVAADKWLRNRVVAARARAARASAAGRQRGSDSTASTTACR